MTVNYLYYHMPQNTTKANTTVVSLLPSNYTRHERKKKMKTQSIKYPSVALGGSAGA